MADSLVSFLVMEEGLNERDVVAKVLSDPEGRPLAARGAPSLLARRPAPPAGVADPGPAG